jgi:DNA invertase Pin-like site-specific DNA recombinase
MGDPVVTEAQKRRRINRIALMIRQGLSTTEICRRCKISRQRLWQIIREAREAS